MGPGSSLVSMKEKDVYYVYFLKSLKDRGYYIGQTTDLDDRLRRHNRGSVKSTKNRRPVKLIYYEICRSRNEACKREWFLKHSSGHREKKEIISKCEISNAG